MKKVLTAVLFTILMLCLSTAAMADVAVNEKNFPDEIFRGFVQQFDTDGNGSLNDDEIEAVTSISCANIGITSMKGVEYFTALRELDCTDNWLSTLDVSKNTALTSLTCIDVRIAELDVSKNTALTQLICYRNQITALDVSNNTALITLRCGENQLTNLDVSKNTALKYLYCDVNRLTKLDVRKNTALIQLNCEYNQLTKLDVSKNKKLERLFCQKNNIRKLDITGNTILKNLVKKTTPGDMSLWYDDGFGWWKSSESGDPSMARYALFIDDTTKVITGEPEILVTSVKLNKTKARLSITPDINTRPCS